MSAEPKQETESFSYEINPETIQNVKKMDFSCHECGKSFQRQKFLKEHMEFVHQGITRYRCSVCDMSFERNQYLRQHVQNKHLEKKFQCESCDYKTATKYNLETHRRTHTGEKPFACEHCPLRFSDAGYFKQHLKIHSGDIKVTCSFCGKQYNKTYIKTHIQSKHSGVSTKRHYEYPDELKQLAIKLAEEVGVYQAAKTLNLKIQAVRKWKSGITEYQGPVQSEEDKLRCKTCLQVFQSKYLLEKHRENVHFEKIVKREIIKYPEHFRKEVADFALHHGQEAARVKYQVNTSTMREWIAFYHHPIFCNECGKPFPYTHDLEKHMKKVHNSTLEQEKLDLESLKLKAQDMLNKKEEEEEAMRLKAQAMINQQLEQEETMKRVQSLIENKVEPHHHSKVKIEASSSHSFLDDSNSPKPGRSSDEDVGFNDSDVKMEAESDNEESDEDMEEMELKPDINFKEEADDYEEEEEEEAEPWLANLTMLIILTAVSLYQLNFWRKNKISGIYNIFKFKLALKKGLIPQNFFFNKIQSAPKTKKKKGPEPKQESYRCEHCGKTFKYKFYYDRHLVVHTGDKTHMCTICGKSFGWRSVLLKHMNMHMGVKYPCNICGKQFSQKGAVLTHYKAVHEEKVFDPDNMHVCEECGKDFKDRNILRIHMGDVHVPASRKTCDLCKTVFSSRSSLNKHTRIYKGKCSEISLSSLGVLKQ